MRSLGPQNRYYLCTWSLTGRISTSRYFAVSTQHVVASIPGPVLSVWLLSGCIPAPKEDSGFLLGDCIMAWARYFFEELDPLS